MQSMNLVKCYDISTGIHIYLIIAIIIYIHVTLSCDFTAMTLNVKTVHSIATHLPHKEKNHDFLPRGNVP